MDLHLLENIVMIAQQGTISKAAEKLYITQSALNQQLLKLEEDVGTPLFNRGGHHMTPTYAGRIYLESARKMLELKKETYHIIRDIADGRSGEIHIAYTPERGAEQFALTYPVFHRKYPGVSFDIHEERVKEMEKHLADGTVDIAHLAIRNQNPDFDYDLVDSEQMVLAVPKSDDLAQRAREAQREKGLPLLDPAWLEGKKVVMNSQETLMRDMVDELYRNARIAPDILFETSSSKTILSVVENGIAIGFLPHSYVKESEKVVFFTAGSRYEWMLTVAHRRGYYLSNAERTFIRDFKDVYWKNHGKKAG